jgi:hypothetical protein
MAKAAKTKAPVVEEDDDAEVELDELDEDVEEEEGSTSRDSEVTFGVSDLARHLSQKTGKTIKPRDLRTLIRKMAREKNPRVDREITAGNRTRYDWPEGLKDPEVKRIIKAVTEGELEAGKKEALQKLKDRKAAQKAAQGDGKAKKTKKTKLQVVEEDDDEDEDLVDDDE